MRNKNMENRVNGRKSKSKFSVKKRQVVLALAGLLTLMNYNEQKNVNNEHATMDFVFNPEDISTEEALKHIVITPEYSSDVKKWLSRHGISLDGNVDSYSIFVNLKDHETIQDKKEAIKKLRNKQSRPILISTDFEGGYVHAIDRLSDEEIEKYGVPRKILELRDEEDAGKNRVSAFPSAEFLGKLYEEIVFNGTYKERYKFLILMQKYGESIRKIMQDIGVDIVFGPCVDIVQDFDGDSPIAKNDRSFGESFILAQDLISSFVNGFQDQSSHVLLVPKHYVGLGASMTDPHIELSESDKNRNSGTETVFKDLINGENSQLNQKKNSDYIGSYKNSRNKDPKYGEILEKNKGFIEYLSNQGKSLSGGEEIKAIMTTHSSGLWGINETITYSKKIIDKVKNNIGKTNKMENGIIFSDDLNMEGANIGLPEGLEKNDVNKILLALASGHDVVMNLGSIPDDIFKELADSIDKGFDINKDGKIDLTRDDVIKKLRKNLSIMVKKGELVENDGKFQLKDATYFDPNVGKTLRDAFYSNQGPISGSGIKEYKAEGNGKSDMLIKKGKSLYEYYVHNGPNAVWKVLKVLYNELLKDDDYKKALSQGKKLVVVDKSECKMFVFTIDGKTLLETHDVGVGKGSSKLDYKHDRRILGDDKTPVGYYMVVDRAMGGKKLKEKGLSKVGWYGGENGGLIALAGPWTPYVAIHGTLGSIGPSSNACVRVLDSSEIGENADKSEQKAINHINDILPDGSFVIITK